VLREEAGGAREVEAAGNTVRELLEDLSKRLPALASTATARSARS
jgi:molybdopterin converting factor small subunit